MRLQQLGTWRWAAEVVATAAVAFITTEVAAAQHQVVHGPQKTACVRCQQLHVSGIVPDWVPPLVVFFHPRRISHRSGRDEKPIRYLFVRLGRAPPNGGSIQVPGVVVRTMRQRENIVDLSSEGVNDETIPKRLCTMDWVGVR